MPLHLVTPIDQAEDARADSDSLDLPAKGWRSHAADLCYIVLRGSTFLASSYLMALGLPLLFFLLISGGDAGVFFAHLANISDRFLGAEQGRQIGFLDEFKFVLIGVATLVVVWRLPRFINDLERELSAALNARLKAATVEKLVDAHADIELPQGMIDNEARELAQRAAGEGKQPLAHEPFVPSARRRARRAG